MWVSSLETVEPRVESVSAPKNSWETQSNNYYKYFQCFKAVEIPTSKIVVK